MINNEDWKLLSRNGTQACTDVVGGEFEGLSNRGYPVSLTWDEILLACWEYLVCTAFLYFEMTGCMKTK